MSATQKRKATSTDESGTEDANDSTASDSSRSTRQRPGKRAKKKAEPEKVLVAETGSDTQSSAESTANKAEDEKVAESNDTDGAENKVSNNKTEESNDNDTDDDADTAATVQVVENREPSPEKVAPLAEPEDLESSQEEVVAEQELAEKKPQEEHECATKEEENEDVKKEEHDEEEEEENKEEQSEEEKKGEQSEEEESMEEDSLNNVSVASSSSRSTRSRTSVRYSTRRSNRPSVHTSKSKRLSVLGRRSSIRHSMRTVTRSTRASMKRTSRAAGPPPAMDTLASGSDDQQSTPEFKHPGSGSRATKKPVVDGSTQIIHRTRFVDLL